MFPDWRNYRDSHSKTDLDEALSEITLDRDFEDEIRVSVLAGNVVVAHEKPININGWIGEGYAIIDPLTGAGAYKISGGNNGGSGPNKNTGITVASGVGSCPEACEQQEIMERLFNYSATEIVFYGIRCKLDTIALGLAVLAIGLYVRYNPTPLQMMATGVAFLREMGSEMLRGAIATVFAMLSLATSQAHAAGTKIVKNFDDCECDPSMISATHQDGRKQCWICARSEYDPITNALRDAKTREQSLKGCKSFHSYDELSERIDSYYNVINARMEERSCWAPDDPGHDTAIDQARSAIRNCTDIMIKMYKGGKL